MSIIKGLFLGLKNQKVIPFNEMTPELHDQISSGLAKIMMAAKMTNAKLTKSQQNYIINQAKQVQEFEDRYITKIKDSAGNIIKKGKEKVADVFDLEGRTLDPSKTIMGGTQEGAAFKSGIMKATGAGPKKVVTEGLPDKEFQDLRRSFRMNIAKNSQDFNQDLAKKIINRELYQDLSDAQRKDFLDNLDFVLKNPRGGSADGGRAGFKEGLLAKMMSGVKPDGGLFKSIFANRNAPIISGFNTSELFDLVSQISSLPGLAEGGRIGYKDGPDKPGRRTFMKAAAGILGALPFGGAKLLSKATPVVTKAAEITGPALAKIVETVMSLGKLVSVKGRRVKEMVTKKKHEGVEVTEDIQDGSYMIKKGDKEIYYKPGRMDETGGIDDDIIEVIEKRVKKAGGGIGYMLGE